jgi:hypothetical protein
MPVFKTVKIGVWENRFIGCVIFGNGANLRIGDPFGLTQFTVCELVRIALTRHVTPVSRIIAIALKMLRQQSPGVRLVISYADPNQGHNGAIYQASNWLYLGQCKTRVYFVNGKEYHPKSLHNRFGGQSIPWLRKHVDPRARRIHVLAKHKYALSFDDEIRLRLLPMAQPYPKRAGSVASDTLAIHAGEGGATPTPALIMT